MNQKGLIRRVVVGILPVMLAAMLLLGPVNQYFYHRTIRHRDSQVASLEHSLHAELGSAATKTQVVKWLERKRIPYKYQVGGKLPQGGTLLGTIPLPCWIGEDYCAIELTFTFGKNDHVIQQGVDWRASGM